MPFLCMSPQCHTPHCHGNSQPGITMPSLRKHVCTMVCLCFVPQNFAPPNSAAPLLHHAALRTAPPCLYFAVFFNSSLRLYYAWQCSAFALLSWDNQHFAAAVPCATVQDQALASSGYFFSIFLRRSSSLSVSGSSSISTTRKLPFPELRHCPRPLKRP